MDNSYTLILILYLQLYSVLCRKVGDKPNIIIVIADDLGYNDVGYHGSEIYTPNIDRLAYGGVRLENYYVQPRCSPSRAELLTGRLAAHTGFYGMSQLERGGLSLTEKLLPEAMTQLGYTSHHIGKWHIGYYNESYLPTSRGYHSFFGFHTGRMDYYTKQKCDKLTKRGASARLCGYDLWQNDHVYVGNDSQMYSTQLFTKRAVKTILKHPVSKPLFMTLAYQGVHSPLQIPSDYERLHPEILSRDRRIYAGMVSCLDEGLGNLTDALKSTGLWNNTVLIFTTDNGASTKFGGSNWPLRGEKNSLFEGGIRAVGFVNSPLLTRHGKISHKLIHITDWYPTSVWLAGGANSRNQDGFNIWNAINERSSGVRRELLLHMNVRRKSLGSSKQDSTGFTAALRQGDWKLIIGNPGEGSWTAPPGYGLRSIIVPSNYTQSFWLFNVHTDPEERYNMANVYPQLTKRLWQRVQEYYSTAEPNPYSSETMMADPSRHGGVWGPWDWKSPTKDDQHCIGICNNYAINNRDKPDKQFNNDLESGWDKVTNWLVHYSRHLYVLF